MVESQGVKLRPSSFHASSTEAAQMKEFLKKKDGGLKEQEKPFLMLKGKKRIHVCQVPKKTSYMNEGDVFVLDTGLAVYVWNGAKASQVKKAKGLEVAHRIRDKEYGAKVDLLVLDGAAASKTTAPFWQKLGDPAEIKTAEAGGDDAEFEKEKEEITFLYTFNGETGEKVLAGQGKEVIKNLLKSTESAVLDGGSEVYVWYGRTTTDVAKEAAAAFGRGLEAANRYPITLLNFEEALKENTVFREKFPDWVEGGGSLSVKVQKNVEAKDWEHKVYDRGACKFFSPVQRFFSPRSFIHSFIHFIFIFYFISLLVHTKVDKIDVDKMAYPEVIAKEVELFDMKHSGVGKMVKVWFCQEREKSELDPAETENFYSKESYVILFEFMQKNREGPGQRAVYVMYYWLGKHCKAGDKGVVTLLAVEIDKQYGAPQVRIVHGKEPVDFASIFGSMMVIHDGSRVDPGLRNALYDVRGYTAKSVKAEQTTLDASYLSSAHSFILTTPQVVYVWHGLGSFDFEEDAAGEMAESLAVLNPPFFSIDYWTKS